MSAITKENFTGNYIHYGIREHAMAAIMNGIALAGDFIPYGGTFLVFSDYCRPAIRLAALSRLQVIFVMTHDSVGVGEDGPTHQPVEHLASLRAIPGLQVMRPADLTETAECWAHALNTPGPSLLALSRQSLPKLRKEREYRDNLCAYGGYMLSAATPGLTHPAIQLIASGSEVGLALQVRDALEKQGYPTSVISMPCRELFEAQEPEYGNKILKPGLTTAVIEAGCRQGWQHYASHQSLLFTIDLSLIHI